MSLEPGALKKHCEEMTMLSNVVGCLRVVSIGEWRCIEFDGNLSFDVTILWTLGFLKCCSFLMPSS